MHFAVEVLRDRSFLECCLFGTFLNPLQVNLNFPRKRLVPNLIPNGSVAKLPDQTAATYCIFFWRWWMPWLHLRRDYKEGLWTFRCGLNLLDPLLVEEEGKQAILHWRMKSAGIYMYHWTQLVAMWNNPRTCNSSTASLLPTYHLFCNYLFVKLEASQSCVTSNKVRRLIAHCTCNRETI